MSTSGPFAIDFFQRNEIEIRRLRTWIHQTFQHRDRSAAAHKAWKEARTEFHARYDQRAFPGGLSAMEAKQRAGEPLVNDPEPFSR
jgi:hypothetical protein